MSSAPARDFPFHAGVPIGLRPAQWTALLLSVAAGYATLFMPLEEDHSVVRLLPALLFPALPLLTLWAMVGTHVRALFGRVTGRHLRLALGVALLNIAVTFAVGLLVLRLFGASSNPAFGALAQAPLNDRILFFAGTVPQLLGEELLTVLPFLGLLALLRNCTRLSRRSTVAIAWLLSALMFGALHLPTYQWNWAQCLLVIGSARLVLSLAYLRTRNLWVSTLAHILNDWMLFGAGLALTAAGQ